MTTPTLFIDRDGTLIEEPPDEQVDALNKIRFMPGVFHALKVLSDRGFRLVMVTNQDGLGSEAFPESAFQECQDFILDSFRSQGIEFHSVFICPHREKDGCGCRKPKTGLLTSYLNQHPIDLGHSAVIGDRETDLKLAAHLGIPGIRLSASGTTDTTWAAVVSQLTERRASLFRKTKETAIDVHVNLEREFPLATSTGIGFFDHMLEQLAKHGGFALELRTKGDLHIDEHHTVEDTAIALGEVIRQALAEKRGIDRYGFVLPMDEAKAQVSLDLSGRALFSFEGRFTRERVGDFPTELVPHFFRSLSDGLGATLHLTVSGENNHHMIEACFKGVGRALRQAMRIQGRDIPSTKGIL
jgi:imidazoleglycerol-phosphate dehydratase / histidinol-phosphatase